MLLEGVRGWLIGFITIAAVLAACGGEDTTERLRPPPSVTATSSPTAASVLTAAPSVTPEAGSSSRTSAGDSGRNGSRFPSSSGPQQAPARSVDAPTPEPTAPPPPPPSPTTNPFAFPPTDRLVVWAGVIWVGGIEPQFLEVVQVRNNSECDAVAVETDYWGLLGYVAFDRVPAYDLANYNGARKNGPERDIPITYSWRWECPWGISERLYGP